MSSGDDVHWAPPQLVIADRTLDHAGRLFVVHDRRGRVLQHRPLAGMAAVEHRYPGWARGTFGIIEPEFPVPRSAGLFALTEAGVVRHVGASADLHRAFGLRGMGEVRRRDLDEARREERARINQHVVAAAVAGRTVDIYLVVTREPGRAERLLRLTRSPRAEAEVLRERVAEPWW